MQFPVRMTFKILALSPQISVTDAGGRLLFYIKQKAFRLKESVTVFADREQTRPVYRIAADRVIDFSAQYHFENESGTRLGAIRRKGMRSLWRAHYEILSGDEPVMAIREENPWSKIANGLLENIPIVGLFSGYLFHPAFLVTRIDGTPVLRVRKQAAFLEGLYEIQKLGELSPVEEGLGVLGIVMMTLLERRRG
jgi:hypothetical protein